MSELDSKSERFVSAFQEADDLLADIIKQNNPIQMSLKQLSKLHHLQRQLEQFKFLNIVYSDASRMRKVFTHQATQQLNLQSTLCTAMNQVIGDFLHHFERLDSAILHIINMQLTHTTFLEMVKYIFKMAFCCKEFALINTSEFDLLSSDGSLTSADATLLAQQYTAEDAGLKDLPDGSQLIKSRFAILLLKGEHTSFAREYRGSLSSMQQQVIIDQLMAIVLDHKKEVYQKDTLVVAIRGTKSITIKNSQSICQAILCTQIRTKLATKCQVHNKGSPQYEVLRAQQINELSFSKGGTLILPVRIQNDIYFYFETENITIDIITFSDYLQQTWQNLTFKVRDLKQQEFLHQMIEVNTPNKLFVGVNEKFDIVYQSGSVPASWSFVEMPAGAIDSRPNLKELKMEQVYKKMLIEKIQDLKVSPKAAIECGSIFFADRQVDIDIFVRRDEADQNPLFYVVFDQPKKKLEDSLPTSTTNIKSDLALEVLTQLKAEKIEKACNILREQLNISVETDEIVELLNQREIENEMLQQENITQEIRDSYVIEYYKTDTRSSMQQKQQQTLMALKDDYEPDEIMSPYRTQKFIRDQQLTNIKKLELFTLDLNDYQNLSDWEFTTVNLPADHTSERIRIVWAMFQLCNFMEMYHVGRDTFYQFLVVVQERYNCRKNPFHNFDHAIQVSHACYFFIKHKLMNPYLDQIEQYAALLSALCHDLDHTGRTNAFELAKKSKLAIRYNDDSVLENHHVSSMFKIMMRDKCNILANISDEQYRTIRKFAISNILATDMKRHFELIKLMELKFAKQLESNEPIIQKEDDKKLVSGAFIHICDLAGPAKHYGIAREWSMRICQEFTAQVDDEMSHGLPITSYLQNLTSTLSIGKNEISFIKVIVKPLYELAVQLGGIKMQQAVSNLDQNQKEWERVLTQKE